MAWVKIDDRQLVNLENIDKVIKQDWLNKDTTYTYYINYTYKDCESKLVIYEQKFEDQASRDRFFDIVETNLNPIKDDRKE